MPNDDQIFLRLSALAPNSDAIKIYVTPAARDDLVDTLEEGGATTREMQEFSAGIEYLIIGVWLVREIGGLDGVASLLKAFFSKNEHKSVRLEVGDQAVEIKGLSPEQAEAQARVMLGLLADQQRQLDESTAAVEKEFSDESPKATTDTERPPPSSAGLHSHDQEPDA